MSKKRVVVSGLGVLSANGIGKAAFWDAIFIGKSGIKTVTLFDTAEFRTKTAGEISDFQPEQFLGNKGLRTLDRSTKLVCSAAKLALDDARLNIDTDSGDDIGVAVGAVFGSIQSISDFDRDALKDGVRYVNPALFSNTVINSPASQLAIKFGIRGFNATIANGFCAGLDALNYAADFIRLGKARIVLAGGVEELCIQTFLGFEKTGLMHGSTLGEGSGILVLEGYDNARNRGASVSAEVLGYGSAGGAKAGLKQAMQASIEESGLSAGDIDYICSGANAGYENDLAEAEAIKELCDQAKKLIVKPLAGECYSAGGALQAIAALGAIERLGAQNVLINAFGPTGNNSSLVIAKSRSSSVI
jgi:3-oxoacyl-[acyl-carrier-protein] synthase II